MNVESPEGEIPQKPADNDVKEGDEKAGRGMSDEVVDDQTKDISDDPKKPQK
jgi:hypothetical protein